ncbi:MAG TPA: M56 family metallopeptidase [Ideonella sp.]|uniref:M56 family metallopeptidase n=1 Tax=Ideonella sp. TaxID=1929293 RepID=UPI002E35D19C|nr:M56 family metallopeptidase [Ideonella sp.]HEX5684487.1 M56 family metallopeptidase [Ideonella sp.]
MNPSWSILESALAQSLLVALWQDALLTALAALVLAAMARRGAAARHVVGLLFLLAMLVVPAWQLGQSLQGSTAVNLTGSVRAADWSTAILPPALADGAAWQAPAWLAWAWCVGVLVMLVRLGGGWWWLRTLERQPLPAPVPRAWQRRAERLCHALGIRRRVMLRLLPSGAQPFTARAWRPIVWLPVAMLTKLAPEQIEALIAHELAHIRRLDWVWNGLQCTIEALLFFHPGVWWLSRRVRIERELACDGLAAAACGDALVVAEALSALENLRSAVPRLALAANGGSLQQRVVHLLSAGQSAGPRWGVAAGLAALVCAGGVWAAQTGTVPAAVAPTAPAAATDAASADDPWWTYVGNSVRIRIDDNGRLRDYHAWVSLTGERHESYRVDGRAAPIDAGVRAWAASHHRASPPDRPELADPAEPEVPELPELPELPPLPPLPPEPPELDQLPAYQAVLAAVQQDANAVARLGSPIQLADDCGPCRIDDTSAWLTLSAWGPKGRATLHAEGRLLDGRWQVQTLDLKPSLLQRLGLAR